VVPRGLPDGAVHCACTSSFVLAAARSVPQGYLLKQTSDFRKAWKRRWAGLSAKRDRLALF